MPDPLQRVVVIHDPLSAYINVYVRAGEDKWLTGDNEVVAIDLGLQPPAFLRLPAWLADDLKQALDGRPEPASNRHLDDAIEVRDRLLSALLERGLPARRSP